MPRSRRRHHSRSRSRSRSHSHDRDRDAKRRKIENYESPHHRRTVSPEHKVISLQNEEQKNENEIPKTIEAENATISNPKEETSDEVDAKSKQTTSHITSSALETDKTEECKWNDNNPINISSSEEDNTVNLNEDNADVEDCAVNNEAIKLSKSETLVKTTITPEKTMSPKQLQRKLEFEKKRQEKQKEREEKLMEKLKLKEEKERQRKESEERKLKERQEKQQQKQKEIEQKQREKEMKEEQKRKEREEKEQKRREKEEKEEQKRKEKELERSKRQQEIDEKNKEKQKQEEQKQKAAAVFVNFFVPLKPNNVEEKLTEKSPSLFMPFKVKTDMRLAPLCRKHLTLDEKTALIDALEKQNQKILYLEEIKVGKVIGKCDKTRPYTDTSEDVIILEENLGQSIYEEKPTLRTMRVKFLKFKENKRPPYYGTWRKKSKQIKARNPLSRDTVLLDYEMDSDDDWEEEEQGESLNGSDDEEKENESDDYEVDNEFFVPHGHLSEDEMDDEENTKLDPESHKTKLKLLKNEFDEEMKSKTKKIQPRLIGCIWYDKNGNNVDDAIHRFLKPLSIITNGSIIIKKRSEQTFASQTPKSAKKTLSKQYVPDFLRLLHGSTSNQKVLVDEFIAYMEKNGIDDIISKRSLTKQMKLLAQWIKCPDSGVLNNKFCWYVSEDVRKIYNVDLKIPNDWNYVTTVSDNIH